MPRFRWNSPTGIALGLTLLWALAFGFNLTPWLRGGPGWVWGYVPVENAARLLPLIAALASYLALAAWLIRAERDHGLLITAALAAFLIALAATYVRHDRPIEEWSLRTLSGLVTGWHRSAYELEAQGGTEIVLADWTAFMARSAEYSSHLSTSAPGMTLTYHWFNLGLAALPPGLLDSLSDPLRAPQCQNPLFSNYSDAQLISAWPGLLASLWGAATVFPLWWLARLAAPDQPRLARFAVGWWPLTPSLALFTPYPSVLYPLIITLALACLLKGLRDSHAGWEFMGGLVMSAASFLSFAMLPALFTAGALTLLVAFFSQPTAMRRAWHWPFVAGLWFGLGLALVWIVLWLASGLSVFEVYNAMISSHFGLEYPYWPWVLLHFSDFLTWMGLPLALLGLTALGRMIAPLRRGAAIPLPLLLAAALWITAIVLDVSGIPRGETGRIWLFMWPPMLIGAGLALSPALPPGPAPRRALGAARRDEETAAVDELAQARERRATALNNWALIGGGQAGVFVLLAALIPTIVTGDLDPRPSAPDPAATFVLMEESGAEFGGMARLARFAGWVDTEGGAIEVQLQWDSQGGAERPYFYSLLPVGPDGQVGEALLVQPFEQGSGDPNRYPLSCWRPDDLLIDWVSVPLPADSVPGDWWISLRLIDGATGESLPVTLPGGTTDQQAGIGPFRPGE